MTQITQINHSNYQNKINEYNTIYQKIKGYLKEVGFLSEENLIYPEQIVDNIYCAIESDKKHLTELATILAGISFFAEEEDKKIILEDLLKKKIDNFICQTVFKKESFLDFVSDWVKSQKEDDKKTIASIHKEITDRRTHLAAKSILKINEDIIFLCIPIFKYFLQIENKREIEEIENIRIDSIPWAYSYAALHFLNDNDIYLNPYNYVDILQIGAFLEYTIKKGSLPENVRYFLIPAALSYAINNTNLLVEEILNSLELRQKAVTAFFDSVDKEDETIKETLPNRQFIKAIEGYKTRTELAKEQLASIGVTDSELSISAYKTAPDSLFSTINGQLPNLTAIFQNQNENISEKFRKVESVFIQDAIERLSKKERDFFNFGQVSYFKISFIQERSYHWVPRRNKRKDEYNKLEQLIPPAPPQPIIIPGPPQPPDTLLLNLPGHIYSLIHIKYINQEKYFILFSDDNIKYVFYEINTTKIKSKEEYLPFLENISAISSKVIEKIKNPSCIVELEKCEILKTEDEPETKLVKELTRIRKDYFRDHLYEAGYEPTILENIADFVKHLIPFYDTIQSLREGKKLEAAGYFALDLLTFLPLIGEAAKISKSMSDVLLSAARLSRIRMTRYLMTGSLIFAIQNTAPFFFRQGILGASNLLTRQTFIDVLKAAVHSVDPGLELFFIGGKYIYQQSNRLRNKILQEFNSYNDYSPIFQNLLISILSKSNVAVPLQKKIITHEMLSNAIELAQSNKYEAVINQLTSLESIVPKVADVQTYPLYDVDYRNALFLREVNYPSANIHSIYASTIASASHLNIPNNPINQLPIEVSLSNTLTHINISSTRIHSLQGLPKKLKYLNISNTIIRELPPLPDKLTDLNISETLIDSLQSLPKKLTYLDISNTMIHELPPLPDTLTHINIFNTQIESLQTLPNALKHLDISKTRIELLPKLPEKLTYLDIEDTSIESLPKLPDKLTYLDISNTEISTLATLPKKLTHLHASSTQIESLPKLPITLTDLDLFDSKIIVLIEDPTQQLPQKLIRLNVSDTRIILLPKLPDTLTDLNIANTKIKSLLNLPKKLNYFNASNTKIASLPKLPDKLTHLDISNTMIHELPPLPDKLTHINISNTLIVSLPTLPDTLTDLNISNTGIYQLPYFLFKTLTRLNIFNTPLLSRTFNNSLPRFLFDCELIIHRPDLDVIRHVQENLSRKKITEQTIQQWIEKDRVEFKITKFLPKNKFSHSSERTLEHIINYVFTIYDTPKYKIGIEDDFHFHRYGNNQESIPNKFIKLRNEFDYFSGEVKKTKEYVILVKNKILDDYIEIADHEFGFILTPKMVEVFDGTRNIYTLKDSKVRNFFQKLLHTKDILIIHEVINRFYFYVKHIEIYLNEYSHQIFFVSTSNFNLNYNNFVAGFTNQSDQERKVIIMIDVILDENSIWSVSHVLMHEISHAIGGAEDLFPTIRSTKNYNINTHLLEIATGKDIHGLDGIDTKFLDSMIDAYTKIHNLPENTISKELFLKIFHHDQMLRANIIMENADFIPHFIYAIARLE